MVVETKDSRTLRTNPPTGHDPGLFPSTCDPHNPFPQGHAQSVCVCSDSHATSRALEASRLGRSGRLSGIVDRYSGPYLAGTRLRLFVSRVTQGLG
jgi:hypothetical protein